MATAPLRKQFKGLWATIRRRSLEAHGPACMTCGFVPPEISELEAHENYSYPGGGVIRLESIQLLCRKCHHTVHLERSLWHEKTKVLFEARRARFSNRRADHAATEAEAAYRAEMIAHYCKVNGVRRRQAESDWKQALPAKDAVPDRRTTTMDFGPFEDEVALARDRRRQWEHARYGDDSDPDRSGLREVWRSLPPCDRATFDNDFQAFCDNDDDRADAVNGGFEMFPDHECPWDIASLRQ